MREILALIPAAAALAVLIALVVIIEKIGAAL